MKTKQEILQELSDREADAPNWSFATLSQERLKIEVLIDIRDTLKDIMKAFLLYGSCKVTGK
ncbi:hypothetical protein ES702_06686 [subsurface metagenome]